MDKFKPLQDYVLVKPLPRSRSEILTVITAETDQGSIGERAAIVAVGPGRKKSKISKSINTHMTVKPGEICMFGGERMGCIKFPQIEIDGVMHKIIQQADILYVEDV